MLYNLLKNLISAGRYDKEDMTNKLNVFFTFDQLTLEEYTELLEMINSSNDA